MTRYLDNGLGGSLGSPLATASNMRATGNIYYVSSDTGTDSSTQGKDRLTPYASFAYVIGTVGLADDDIVVLLDGHTETIDISGGAKAISTRLILLGEGSTSSGPPAKLKSSGGANNMFDFTAQVIIENVTFETHNTSGVGRRLSFGAGSEGSLVYGCRFEDNDNIDNAGVYVNTTDITFQSCTFISTSTTSTTRPARSVYFTGSADRLRLIDCTLDGGSYGWANPAIQATAAVAPLFVRGLSLLNGADVSLDASSTGVLTVLSATGGGQVIW